eukprot:gene21924-62888_t
MGPPGGWPAVVASSSTPPPAAYALRGAGALLDEALLEELPWLRGRTELHAPDDAAALCCRLLAADGRDWARRHGGAAMRQQDVTAACAERDAAHAAAALRWQLLAAEHGRRPLTRRLCGWGGDASLPAW